MHSALKHWSMSSASWIEMDALLAEFTDRVRREGLDEYFASLGESPVIFWLGSN